MLKGAGTRARRDCGAKVSECLTAGPVEEIVQAVQQVLAQAR